VLVNDRSLLCFCAMHRLQSVHQECIIFLKLQEPRQNSKLMKCHIQRAPGWGPKNVLGAQLKSVVARTTWRLEFLHRARYILVPCVQSVHGVHGVHSLHTRRVQTSFSISSKCRGISRNEMHIILLCLIIFSPFSKTSVTPLNTFQVSVAPVQPATIRHITTLLEHRIS
jgi:hypothetical protein